MERNGFRLIGPADAARRPPRGRWPALGLLAVLVAVAGIATLLGADAALRQVAPRETAQRALERALAAGNDDPAVRRALAELRSALGSSPLDSKTRVAYASLLLAIGRRVEDVEAAAFHAERAAELAPVTLSVARSAALVLARSRRSARGLELVRAMFEYAPVDAARLLARVERIVVGDPVPEALADTPQAGLAWSVQLHAMGRKDEAADWLRRTHRRWPEHLPTLDRLAEAAVVLKDWAEAGRLLPDDLLLPETPASAPILLHRARLRAARGERGPARRDVERALLLDGGAPRIREMAGRAYLDLDEPEQARRQWNRALHLLSPGPGPARQRLLLALARLEDEQGRVAAALRLWGALLDIDPGHREAERRFRDLGGTPR